MKYCSYCCLVYIYEILLLQVKYGKTISAVDVCSVDDVDDAVEEAKKKFQAILKIRK